MNVKVTKRAERRIEIVDRFWRKNRQAPDLLKDELAVAAALLSQDPYAGTACVVRGKELWRLLLPRTEQWVYYVFREKQGIVVVQTIWGARRGREASHASGSRAGSLATGERSRFGPSRSSAHRGSAD